MVEDEARGAILILPRVTCTSTERRKTSVNMITLSSSIFNVFFQSDFRFNLSSLSSYWVLCPELTRPQGALRGVKVLTDHHFFLSPYDPAS